LANVVETKQLFCFVFKLKANKSSTIQKFVVSKIILERNEYFCLAWTHSIDQKCQ